MRKLIKEYPEAWALPLLLIVWVVVRPVVLQWLGAGNIVLPDDTLQGLLFAAIELMVAGSFVLLGIRFNFPTLYKWYKQTMIEGKQLSSEQSSRHGWWFFLVFCTLVLGFILGVNAIM